MQTKKICYEKHSIHERMELIYGQEKAQEAIPELSELIHKYRQRIESKAYHLSEKDAILITYGDQIQRLDETPLESLYTFLDTTLKGSINSVHILPFYPYSSDDGFSVVNYSEVYIKLGN